jgi:outer membrane immunogenic protein
MEMDMKRSFLLAALLLGAGSPAIAADIPVKAPRPAPVLVETWNWNGFYIGVNGGYSWGRSRTDVGFFNSATGAPIVPPPGAVTSANFNLNGGIAGGQVGYNWAGNGWLWGFELDAQWSGEKGSAVFSCPNVTVPAAAFSLPCLPGATFLPTGSAAGTTLSLEQQIEWFGTLRARAGWLVTPSVVLYATGGLAFGSIKSSGTLSTFTATQPGVLITQAFSGSQTKAGWTAGGGIEGHLGGNWTGKLEYLYMDLGTVTGQVSFVAPPIGATFSSRITDHIFRAGINYHFPPDRVMAKF